MIIVYIILLFIAVLLFMLLLGFIDIVYNLVTGKTSNLAEKFCEAMNVIVGVITVCNWHVSYQKINEYAKTSDVLL